MMNRIYLVPVFLLAVGCGGNDIGGGTTVAAPPAAAVLTAALGSLSLQEKLKLLDWELAAGQDRGKVDDQAIARFFRAEAVTDRLLESTPSYSWLAEGYDLEARLRQIQSLADRVVAQIRRGSSESEVLADVASLRRQVADLQRSLTVPGVEAPPSLDLLLAAVRADSIRALVTEGATGE
jgi:hypothetical protein